MDQLNQICGKCHNIFKGEKVPNKRVLSYVLREMHFQIMLLLGLKVFFKKYFKNSSLALQCDIRRSQTLIF
jgi:hypothetical protein